MAIVIKPITLEVSKPNVFQAIAAKQGDSNSRFLKATIVNEGEKIPILPTSTVTINAKRNDGQSKSFFGKVNDDGTATVPIHSWILELPGYVNCDISIIDTQESKLTTTSFTLLVEEASHNGDDISEEEQYDFITEVVSMVSKKADKDMAANAIRNTASGNVVTLTDISPLEHILAVKARSENMIPYPYVVSTQTTNGVTFTDNGDGSVTVNTPNGPATATTFYIFQTNITLPKGDYTLSGCPKGGSPTGYMMMLYDNANNQSDTGNGRSFVLEKETVYQRIYIRVESGTTVDNVTFYPQLTIGTEVKPYIPFVDVSKVNVIRTGKNLISYHYEVPSQTNNGVTFTDNGNGSVSVLGATSTSYASCMLVSKLEILANTEYTLSGGFPNCYVILTAHDKVSGAWKADVCSVMDTAKTFTVTEEIASSCYLRVYLRVIAGATVSGTAYPMLETGTIATEFEKGTKVITYTPNADGTVEGVTSIYPTTTLISDTEGIVLDATYNADTKKYIDNKIAELAAMIVNS